MLKLYYSLPMLILRRHFLRAETMVDDNNFLDSIDDSNETLEPNMDIESLELAEKRAEEQAQKNLLARKRIDELKEKKRLKELLDDEDDW